MPTQDEIAKHLDMAPRRLREMLHQLGLPSRGNSLETVRVTYIRHLRELAAGRKAESGDDTYDLVAERARLAHAQANKTELEVRVLQGHLIPQEIVKQVLAGMLAAFRAKALSIPTKAAPQILPLADLAEAEAVLTNFILEALGELHEFRPGDFRPADGRGHGGGEAAAETDGEPVGGRKPKAKQRGQRRARQLEH